MTGAIAVLRPPRRVAALDRLPGTAALHRGGIHDPDIVAPQRRVHGQHPDYPDEQEERLPHPLVPAGLADRPREHARQFLIRVPQPPPLRGESQQGGHHRHRQQLRIAERERSAGRRADRGKVRPVPEHVIDLDVHCSSEGLDVVFHNSIMETLASSCGPSPWNHSSSALPYYYGGSARLAQVG